MDIWSCLKEVAILIVVYEITIAESDLLEGIAGEEEEANKRKNGARFGDSRSTGIIKFPINSSILRVRTLRYAASPSPSSFRKYYATFKSFRPREDNPPELNEFLNSVLDHRSDFSYIKEAARRYQKMKKDTQDVDPLNQPMEFYTGYQNNYKADMKRHAHSYHGLKKFRNFAAMQPKRQQKKSHRYRRHVKRHIPQQFYVEVEDGDGLKRRIPQQILAVPNQKPNIKRPIPSQIFIEPQGEKLEKRSSQDILVEPEGKKGELRVRGTKSTKTKKQAMYVENPVHHASKYHRERDRYNQRKANREGNFYYVDLEDAAQREQSRYGDRRRYGFNPQRPSYYRPYDKIPNRPCAKAKEEKMDYPIYENEPHHNLNDEVAFERALSYEVEPKVLEQPNYNNPSGNNLYSVDEGRPDNIQPFYPLRGYLPGRFQGDDYPQAMSNERFFIDGNNNLKKIESTTTTTSCTSTTTESLNGDSTTSSSEAPTTEATEKKTVKQVGNGFIEISKTRRNDEETSLQQPLVRQDDDYGGSAVSSVPFRSQPKAMKIMEAEDKVNGESGRSFVPLETDPRALHDEETRPMEIEDKVNRVEQPFAPLEDVPRALHDEETRAMEVEDKINREGQPFAPLEDVPRALHDEETRAMKVEDKVNREGQPFAPLQNVPRALHDEETRAMEVEDEINREGQPFAPLENVPRALHDEETRAIEIEDKVNREGQPFVSLENVPRSLHDEGPYEDNRRPDTLPKNPIQHLQSVQVGDRDYEGPSFISRDLRNAGDRQDKQSSIRTKESLQTLEEKDAANEIALEPSLVARDAKNDEETEDADRDERHVQAENAKNEESINERSATSEKAPLVEKYNEDDKDVIDRDERNVVGEKPSPVSEEVSNDIDKAVKDTVDRFNRDSILSKESLSDKEEEVNADEDSSAVPKNSVSINEIANEADKEMKEVDDYDHDESSILSKHSLHPLRVRDDGEERFQSRKLQFIDEEMAKVDGSQDYLDLPNRPRRDFLDALGMKNEEDYSEDNPYKDAITVNNTDINNDTFCQNSTSTTTAKCIVTTTPKSTVCPQKEDIKNIKQILEEPKEVTAQNTVGDFKKDKEKKIAMKRHLENEELDGYGRRARDTSDMIEVANVGEKIRQNSKKIYNQREDMRNRKYNNQELMVPKWERNHDVVIKKSADLGHKIDKKENNEFMVDLETTTLFPPVTNSTTESENVNSTYEQVARQMDIENEKLAQVVNGHLATKIVSTVFDELKKKTSLRAKFYSGLSRKHVDFAGTIDFDIFKTNETEDVDEARLLLDQITKVLNKLVLNQVRRKLCQRLPDELKEYLETILNVKNTLEAANFVPNTKQGDFLFTYQENSVPPFNVRKLQETLMQLEGLLLSYNNLNEDCQSKAEPVKEYIEKHVKMLKQMVACPTHNCGNSESKRNSPPFHNLLVEKDLESLGLGNKNNFVPDFDLNQLVRNKMKIGSLRKDQKRDTQKNGAYRTEKYKKLQLAAEKVREKRENEAKIAELFGGKKKRSAKRFEVDYEEPLVYSLE